MYSDGQCFDIRAINESAARCKAPIPLSSMEHCGVPSLPRNATNCKFLYVIDAAVRITIDSWSRLECLY